MGRAGGHAYTPEIAHGDTGEASGAYTYYIVPPGYLITTLAGRNLCLHNATEQLLALGFRIV